MDTIIINKKNITPIINRSHDSHRIANAYKEFKIKAVNAELASLVGTRYCSIELIKKIISAKTY